MPSEHEAEKGDTQSLSTWLGKLDAIAPPQDPDLRAKLERKLQEYARRLASMQVEGTSPPLHRQEYLMEYYKFLLLDTILKAKRDVNTADVVSVILEKHGLEGLDLLLFVSACGVIMTYLGKPPPGEPISGGTGI